MITINDTSSHTFVHASVKDSRGQHLRCRRTGKAQTWKKWPGLFRIPVKYGLRDSFYIQNFSDGDLGMPAQRGQLPQNRNDHDWCVPARWAAEHVLFEGVTP